MGLYDFSFYDLIERNAVSFPGSHAWLEVDDGRRITYSMFKEKVDSLSGGLFATGIGKGDRIGVIGKNSLEYFLVYGAAAATGAIVLPVNWRLSAEEMAYNLADCTPKAVFVDKEFQETFQDISSGLPSVEKAFNLKADEGSLAPYASLFAGSGKRVDAGTDDGFVIIHTAAVEGKPRGALLSHGNMLCAALNLQLAFGLGHTDVHLNLLPLFHVGGLFMAAAAFSAGALNVNMSKFDADKAAELIDSEKVSFFFDFPPILSSILEKAQEKSIDLTCLKNVIGLGVKEDIEAYQAKSRGTYWCMYGQTETSMLATLAPYNECPGSAGRILPTAMVRLVDEYDRPVECGSVGEITVKGPMVFKGYWNREEDTAYTFRDGWHHTGDLGRLEESGFIFYAGRKAEKELIKPGGENVYPAEVEKAILMHPDVRQAVVFGVPDPKWKEGIKAVCVLEPGKSLDPKELISFVGSRIASYKKPHYVQFVGELPEDSAGGIDRPRVKELYGKE